MVKRTSLILALLVSGSLHAGILTAFSTGVFDQPRAESTPEGAVSVLSFAPLPRTKPAEESAPTPPPPPPPPVLAPPPPPPERELVAGIDQGSPQAKNWQGFETATPHAAPLSEVEQSAMTPQAGRPAPPAPPAPPRSDSVASPAPSVAAPTEAEPAEEREPSENASKQGGPEAQETSPQEEPREAPPTEVAGPAPAGVQGSDQEPEKREEQLQRLGPEDELGKVPEAGAKPTGEDAATQPPVNPAPLSPIAPVSEPPPDPFAPPVQPLAAPPTPPASPTTPGAPASGPQLGEIAPEESDASAVEESLAIAPGRTLARDGIEIRTARARWSSTTRVTAIPRNPILEVTFDATGKVVRAAYLPGKSTGYPDVDRPLLDAIYRWRASGEKFQVAVAKEKVLKFKIKVLLIEESRVTAPLPIPQETETP